MSENATIIHHYFENSSSLMLALVALIVVVVILFLIVAGVIIYLLIKLSRHRRPRHPRQPPPTTREMHGYENEAIDNTSSCNAATPVIATERDVLDNNNNAQSIPMKTFRPRSRADGRRQDSSDSSSGLYDVIFPEQHDPPTKLGTFAGQVFASNTRPGSDEAGPSGSGQPCDSDSLVWDYFQQGAGTPASSEVISDADPGVIDNICWV